MSNKKSSSKVQTTNSPADSEPFFPMDEDFDQSESESNQNIPNGEKKGPLAFQGVRPSGTVAGEKYVDSKINKNNRTKGHSI